MENSLVETSGANEADAIPVGAVGHSRRVVVAEESVLEDFIDPSLGALRRYGGC